jgi:polyhydroxybutyrate depolymerase
MSLVLGFHGGFGNAAQFEEQSLLSEKADEAGFIVIYPDGLGFLVAPNLHFWNAGICCAYPYLNDIDDVNFIRNLIDNVTDEYAIDTNRVYATGMSNGAFMSYRLACELSDKIAAIAPVAGGMVIDECPSDRIVPIIHFHSYQDENIPYSGGIGDGASSHHNPPLDSVFTVWAEKGTCSTANDTVYHGADYTYVSWRNCDCEAEIDYYITTDGGHSWPGGTSPALGDPVSTTLNANDLMWDFFQQHDLGCGPSGLGENDAFSFNVYPNPSSSHITIEAKSGMQAITIYNSLGQLVYSTTANNAKIIMLDLSKISQGTYIINIQTIDNSYSEQLIIE